MSGVTPEAGELGLRGRRGIVTGAAGAIGGAIAEALARCGATVFAVDRDGPSLAERVGRLGGSGDHVAHPFDLADTGSIGGVVDAAERHLGSIDFLVHAAAMLRRSDLTGLQLDDWDEHIKVNLTATVFLGREVAQRMVTHGSGGRVVNFASTVWDRGSQADAHAYAISKAGVVTFTRTLAREFGRYNVLSNIVAPGQIDTPMQHVGNDREHVARIAASCPLGRMGTAEEVAGAVLFLVSPHASFVNGSIVTVSGGADLG